MFDLAAGTALRQDRTRWRMRFDQIGRPDEGGDPGAVVFELEPAPQPAPLPVSVSGAIEAPADGRDLARNIWSWRDKVLAGPVRQLTHICDARYVGHGVVLGQGPTWQEFSLPRYGRPDPGAPFVLEGRRLILSSRIRSRLRIEEPLLSLGDAPDHFGHFLLECVTRLWAADVARRLGRRLCVFRRAPFLPWQAAFLRLAGVDPQEVRLVDRPCVLSDLLLASPLHALHQRSNPALAGFAAGMATTARAEAPPRGEARLFLSRRGADRRRLVNEHAVAALFASRGFTVIQPERLPLVEQVARVGRAPLLAGPFGSQMHLSMFQPPGGSVFCLAPVAFCMPDDAAMAAVRGGKAHYHLCRPVAADGRRPLKQRFEADLSALEPALDAWLAEASR